MNWTWIIVGGVIVVIGGIISSAGYNWDKWHKLSSETSEKPGVSQSLSAPNANIVAQKQHVDNINGDKYEPHGDYVAGDKYVFGKIDRIFSDEQKRDVLARLKTLKVSSVTIHFEYTAETQSFVDAVAFFLRNNGYSVYGDKDARLGSGIPRNEFNIREHPSDPNFAVISIGAS